ncbi:hypothetical protein, partial [uncultured Pseudomonas sp.]|uniref:hypothetical protein n=1 Tax=uncultured Pseudomonas sp. TaxID=114707 RepID=UPI0025840811
MYFVEWLSWLAYIDPKEERDAFEKQHNKAKRKTIYESDEQEMIESAKKSASNTPKSRGPVYAYNEHILEMRCGMWENKRGLISILSVALIVYSLANITIVLEDIKFLFSLSLSYNGEPYGERLFLASLFLTMGIGTLWLYLKFGLRFTRFEMFTSRHLLIRFNRTTQQVYLHRPSYCGGIVTLPWHGVMCSGSDKKYAAAGSLGLPLDLMWQPSYAGALHPELVHVGKAANNFTELQDEWEFIRRFMDEGPEGLPRPRITSHFPWPWQAFTPQFEGLT